MVGWQDRGADYGKTLGRLTILDYKTPVAAKYRALAVKGERVSG